MDNPFVVPIQGPKGAAFVLAFQPKSFDWRTRGGKPHPWGGGHGKQLKEALDILARICGLERAP